MNLLNLKNSGQFQEEQVKDPAFWHAFREGLVCCNSELLQLDQLNQTPCFVVNIDVLYHIDNVKRQKGEVAQLLVPQ